MNKLDKVYSITLADGTILSDLKLNGNNYISTKEIKEEVFEDNLYSVTIYDGEKEEVHANMELVQLIEYEGAYWFILRDIPAETLDRMKLQSGPCISGYDDRSKTLRRTLWNIAIIFIM